jgi:hypothetical protein
MKDAVRRLVGEHDFRNFCKVDPPKQLPIHVPRHVQGTTPQLCTRRQSRSGSRGGRARARSRKSTSTSSSSSPQRPPPKARNDVEIPYVTLLNKHLPPSIRIPRRSIGSSRSLLTHKLTTCADELTPASVLPHLSKLPRTRSLRQRGFHLLVVLATTASSKSSQRRRDPLRDPPEQYNPAALYAAPKSKRVARRACAGEVEKKYL